MSRATDAHVILRRHAKPDCAVMEAAVRSWPPLPPRCLRWAYPVWSLAPDLDPLDLALPARRPRKPEPEAALEPRRDGAAEYVRDHVTAPVSRVALEEAAYAARVPLAHVHRWLAVAMERGLIHPHEVGGRPGYAPGPQPELPTPPPEPKRPPRPLTKRQRVEGALREHPDWTAAQVAEDVGTTAAYVRQCRRGGGDRA